MGERALDDLIAAVEAGTWPLEPQKWMTGTIWTNICAAFGGSLDAAKDLHEALLPGWGWNVDSDGLICVSKSGSSHRGKSPLPARAWLLAILRARAAAQEKGGG